MKSGNFTVLTLDTKAMMRVYIKLKATGICLQHISFSRVFKNDQDPFELIYKRERRSNDPYPES